MTGLIHQDRLVSIEVLRFAASLSVVAYHAADSTRRMWGLAENPLHLAAYGVDVFFVLSGFVIALTTRPSGGAAEFMLKRVARVVPLYWLLTIGVATIAIVAPTLLNSTEFSVQGLIASLLFIPHTKGSGAVEPLLFVGWSLNYEMFFYAVVALTLLLPKWSALFPCAIILILVTAGALWPSHSTAWTFYTAPIALEFVFGVLAFLAWDAAGRPSLSVRAAMALLAAALLWFAFGEIATLPRLLGPGVAAVLLLGAALAWKPASDNTFIAALAALGGASYALYLSHPYVLGLVNTVFLKRVDSIPAIAALSCCAVAVSIVASLILFHLFERPAQKFVLSLGNSRRNPPRVTANQMVVEQNG